MTDEERSTPIEIPFDEEYEEFSRTAAAWWAQLQPVER